MDSQINISTVLLEYCILVFKGCMIRIWIASTKRRFLIKPSLEKSQKLFLVLSLKGGNNLYQMWSSQVAPNMLAINSSKLKNNTVYFNIYWALIRQNFYLHLLPSVVKIVKNKLMKQLITKPRSWLKNRFAEGVQERFSFSCIA